MLGGDDNDLTLLDPVVAGWAPQNPMDDTPFGRELPLSAEAKTTPEGYTGKPLDLTFGLQAMNHGARFYDPRLGRWWQRDPLAEKFADFSPFQYVLCSPFTNIDPDGRDTFTADDKGNLSSKLQEDNLPNGIEVLLPENQQGPPLRFTLQDPLHDTADIKGGVIRKIEMKFLDNANVESELGKSGVNDFHIFPVLYAANESRGTRRMDYFVQSCQEDAMYMRNGMAYNPQNMGNYLWGAGMRRLGFSLSETKAAAMIYSRVFDMRHEWDSPDDQDAIDRGYNDK